MAIKNWTVKTKQIKRKHKGLINHFNYLFNENRPAHFYSEIVDLNNSPEKLKNILDEVSRRKDYRRKNGLRGGGVSNLATSFVLSLPRGIQQPTKKEWQKITAITLKELSYDIDIPFSEIKKYAVVVLHDESKSLNKSNHLHILISNVIDGKVVKKISQYQGTYSMKKGFNKAVKHVINEDHKMYVPLNVNVKDVPLYVAREKNLQSLKTSIYLAREMLGKWLYSIKKNQKKDLENKAKESAKAIIKIKNKLPKTANEIMLVAKVEEERNELLEELKNECKVSHQVKNEQVKRRKRTRTKNKIMTLTY